MERAQDSQPAYCRRTNELRGQRLHFIGRAIVEAVLDRRAGEDERVAAAQALDGLRRFARPVLDALRLVEHDDVGLEAPFLVGDPQRLEPRPDRNGKTDTADIFAFERGERRPEIRRGFGRHPSAGIEPPSQPARQRGEVAFDDERVVTKSAMLGNFPSENRFGLPTVARLLA